MKYTNNKLVEFEEWIKNKNVAVIGLGVSNIPLIKYLHNKKANVSIFNDKEIDKIDEKIVNEIKEYNFKYFGGEDYLSNLKGFDIIFRAPSCMPTKKELLEESARGAIVTTEIEMLMKLAPCKIIGITGSDGKTTTTSLIDKILKDAGYKTFLGGNIGTPLFTKLSEMKPNDILVLELSSFQLMHMTISPNISVITNITPNHLNIHKDYEEYIEAKKNVIKYQNKDDVAILNYDNEITRKCGKEVKGKRIYFSSKTQLEDGFIVEDRKVKQCIDGIRKHILNTEDVILRGNHNFENIATAIAATSTLVDIEEAAESVKTFKPVEHRLEYIREIDGVKWYNDSVSSSPTRTIAGLNSFDEDIVLIAGGYDKNLDYTPIAKPILDHVKTLILLGQTSDKIYEAVTGEAKKQSKEINIYRCTTLQETVETAKAKAKKGEIILFSPASASFDLFKNFADRGNQFKELVNKI